jgi:butyryl-CoA dehydrogenase
MGFIEETGAAQFYRDARILTIYEGTTAIQANDLVGRKTARDGGKTARAIIAQMRKTEAELAAHAGGDLAAIRNQFTLAIRAFEDVVAYVAANARADIRAVYAGSVPYLMLAGTVVGGWNMARAALVAQARLDAGETDPFYGAKIKTARFYADYVLTRAAGLCAAIVGGAEGVLALTEEQF